MTHPTCSCNEWMTAFYWKLKLFVFERKGMGQPRILIALVVRKQWHTFFKRRQGTIKGRSSYPVIGNSIWILKASIESLHFPLELSAQPKGSAATQSMLFISKVAASSFVLFLLPWGQTWCAFNSPRAEKGTLVLKHWLRDLWSH